MVTKTVETSVPAQEVEEWHDNGGLNWVGEDHYLAALRFPGKMAQIVAVKPTIEEAVAEGEKELRAAAINALTMEHNVGRPKLVIAKVVKVQ